MNRYIALLRAINVGGYRKIKMEDLREMFSSMGYENPVTYIASGNVIFDAGEEDSERIADSIEQQIRETFGHEVPVAIRTRGEIESILDRVPFEEQEGWMLYVTFLPGAPPEARARDLESVSGAIETYRVIGREVYSFVDKQTDEKPNFSNSFIEKQLDMAGTTRNIRTVRKVRELAAGGG